MYIYAISTLKHTHTHKTKIIPTCWNMSNNHQRRRLIIGSFVCSLNGCFDGILTKFVRLNWIVSFTEHNNRFDGEKDTNLK